MAKITNRLEEIKYWSKKREESLKKSIAKKRLKPVVYKKAKPRQRIKPVSKKESKRKVKYSAIRKEFFLDPKNQLCLMRLIPECIKFQQPATEVHHGKGRIGELLFNTKFFIPGCTGCHRYAELHPEEAKEKGVSFLRLSK